MGILTARMILGDAGIEFFALYALITTLPALMQFQDLGAGAALVNAIATRKEGDPEQAIASTLMSVWRIMICFSGVVLIVNLVLFLTGGWSFVLGEAGSLDGARLAAFSCISVWAISVPMGIWQRVLLGLNKNYLIILIQGVIPPLNFVFVWLILQGGPAMYAFAGMATYLSTFVVAVTGLAVAVRQIWGASLLAVRQVWFPKRYPGVRVMDVGWPMMAQMLSTPLSISAQRYVLAQSATTVQVAEYTAAAQIYLSLLGMISAAGVALWPSFARQRAAGTLRTSPYRLSIYFAVACTAALAMFFLVRDPVFWFTTKGEVHVQASTAIAFSLMLIAQAALYPLGMFIMDVQGIRFQVAPTLIMAFSSLFLSILVTPTMGAIGPLLSNVVCVVFAQVIPFSIYIHRNRARLWQSEAS
ncbi:MAG: hypothetical protein QM708_11385 [Propioniciclava sp.]|uniref:hypothetical protein n=1 Tax=Propioniciclava sp. TaxID=2038686 RepID=UPI0039E37614